MSENYKLTIMKELSIEEKAKCYDEAIERVKELLSRCIDDRDRRTKVYRVEDIETIFPELKESEDERTRKKVIEYMKTGTYNRDYIRYADRYSYEIWRKLMDNFKNIKDYHIGCNEVSDIVLNAIIDTFNWLEKGGDKNKVSKHVEAINEEKVDDANKVEPKDYNSIDPHFSKPVDKDEPKFKIGDWITDGYLHCKISDVLDDRYIVDTKFGKRSAIPFKRENNYHLWSIQDAKDGDILIYNDSIFIFDEIYENDLIYYGIYEHNKFHNDKYYSFLDLNTININNIYPATKEQRDTLEKAMTDAGYTFDFEKKELKKIEQVRAKWSEEDELSCFESALFTAFSDAWQSYLLGEDVNVKQWAKEQSKELLEAAKEELVERT